MLKYFTLLSCILLIGAGSVRSQSLTGQALRDYRLNQILESIKEKTHMPAGKILGDKLPTLRNDDEESILSSNDSNEKVSNSTPESEVHAAINPTDSANIVVGAMNDNPTAGLTFPIYYTTNSGKKWNKSSFRPLPYEGTAAVEGGGDPVFAYDADGKLYMSWLDLYSAGTAIDSAGWQIDTTFWAMYWASSTNGGQTWVRAANGYIGRTYNVVKINLTTFQEILGASTGSDDKEWIAVDRTNSKFHNSLYVAHTYFGLTHNVIEVLRKPPGVDSMLPPVQATTDSFLFVQYSDLGIDSKGGIHVTFSGSKNDSTYAIYEVISTDGGATFGPAIKISDDDVPGFSTDGKQDVIFGIRANGNYPCPKLSIDTAGTGDLYEVFDGLGIEADSGIGSQIFFSRSTDNGGTWSQPHILNNDLDSEGGNYIDHFYPSIAVNGKGTISVTWYDRREDPNNQIGRYYIAQSSDQGQTWTNAPVAAIPMDFSKVMDVNQNFGIGEYTQVVTTPYTTIPIWTDGRDNAGGLRIYAAFISPASSGVNSISTVSEGISLSDNYPNPFSSTTNLSFTLATSAHATLYVSNIAGQRVVSLFDGIAEAGEHDITFDGSHLANGVYYLNLESDLGIVRRAMTILR